MHGFGVEVEEEVKIKEDDSDIMTMDDQDTMVENSPYYFAPLPEREFNALTHVPPTPLLSTVVIK